MISLISIKNKHTNTTSMKNNMKNTITKEQLIKKLDAEIIVEFSSEDDVVTI